MKHQAFKTRNEPKEKKWPHDVLNGTELHILDWWEEREAAKLAASCKAFENPALENLIAYRLKIASIDEGFSHDLYQKLHLRFDTLAEHLSAEPAVEKLPTAMLCDAVMYNLTWFDPYSMGDGLGYSTRDRARFDFSVPVVDFPFDPGPLTFLFKDLAKVGLCERAVGGFKWADLAIATFRRLNLWPYDKDFSAYQMVWDAFPLDIKRSALSGVVDVDDLEELIGKTNTDLIAKGKKAPDGVFERQPGMGHTPFADIMLKFIRSGMARF